MDKIIKFKMKYTPEDLQKAYSLHYKKLYRIRSKILSIIGVFVLIDGLYCMLVYKVVDLWAYVLVIEGFLFIGLNIWQLKSIGKRMYKYATNLRDPYEFEIYEDKISIKNPKVAIEAKYEYYSTAVVSNDIILLYQSKLAFNFFFRKSFKKISDFEWFKENVRKRVGKVVE